jgi:hypothetical protein
MSTSSARDHASRNPSDRKQALPIVVAAAIPLLLPWVIVAFKGDPLYLGLWYYVAVPLSVIGSAALVRPGGWFLIGVAVTLSFSFLAYQWIQLTGNRPEGLLGLGHVFSVPGAFIATLGAAIVARLRSWRSALYSFLAGLCASAAGFLIAQLVVCSTLMYCGMLSSWPVR